MTAIDDLINEHKAVVVALAVLEKVVASISADNSKASDDLADLLDFFTGFVDRCHHAKEEEILFPELERALQGREGEVPIRSMLSDHAEGRKHVEALRQQLERHRSGDVSAIEQMAQQANAYRRLLSSHIEKENEVLFVAAKKFIPADVASRLPEQFERIEQDRIGKGKHDQYHSLLHRLKTSYAA